MRRRRSAAGVAALLTAAMLYLSPHAPPLLAGEPDPQVPAASSPRGAAIALVSAGVDYLEDGLAARIARDGEGEIIGYDFKDDDRRPFNNDRAKANASANVLLGDAVIASLVPIRTDFENLVQFSKALKYAGQSPAPIIVVDGSLANPKTVISLAGAARYFYDRLFVVAAGDERRDLDHTWPERFRNLDNVLIVAGTDADGKLPGGANWGAGTIDLSTDGRPARNSREDDDESPDRGSANSGCAAARIAALASRLRVVEPAIPASALKVRIVALAAQPKDGRARVARNGYLARPEQYFRLE